MLNVFSQNWLQLKLVLDDSEIKFTGKAPGNIEPAFQIRHLECSCYNICLVSLFACDSYWWIVRTRITLYRVWFWIKLWIALVTLFVWYLIIKFTILKIIVDVFYVTANILSHYNTRCFFVPIGYTQLNVYSYNNNGSSQLLTSAVSCADKDIQMLNHYFTSNCFQLQRAMHSVISLIDGLDEKPIERSLLTFVPITVLTL